MADDSNAKQDQGGTPKGPPKDCRFSAAVLWADPDVQGGGHVHASSYQQTAISPRWFRKPDVWVAIFTGMLVGVGIATAKLLLRQLSEMHATTVTAQTQLELSERPWIKIIDAKPSGDVPVVGGLSFQKIGPFKDDPDIQAQATLQIVVTFSNIGHSVADVAPNAELFMPQFSTSEYWNRVNAEEKKFCDSRDNNISSAPRFTVFPDESQPFTWRAGISAPIHAENVNHIPEGSGITPSLVVCVSYRHKGLPNPYQTRAVYTVLHLGGARFFYFGDCNITPFPNISPITFCNGGTPAKLLRLDREPMADDAY